MTHWLSLYYCYAINTRQLIRRILFNVSLLWKTPGDKTFWLISAFQEHLSFVCPLFPTWVRFRFNKDGFWGPFFVIWNFLVTWSGLIMGEWHSLSPLIVEFLWTWNSQLGQHKPGRTVHVNSNKYYSHILLIFKWKAQFINAHIYILSCPKL